MDPNACLTEALELSKKIQDSRGPVDRCDADRLAQAVEAMNEWLSSGGFLPNAWKR